MMRTASWISLLLSQTFVGLACLNLFDVTFRTDLPFHEDDLRRILIANVAAAAISALASLCLYGVSKRRR
jgi:hypothetical protein